MCGGGGGSVVYVCGVDVSVRLWMLHTCIQCPTLSLQISRTPFQDPQSGTGSLHPTECRGRLPHSRSLHQCSQTVSLCGSVKERSLQCASGGGTLSLHLPGTLQVLQGPSEDADRGGQRFHYSILFCGTPHSKN